MKGGAWMEDSQQQRKHKRNMETNERANIKEGRHSGGRRSSGMTCNYARSNSSFHNDLPAQRRAGILIPSPMLR